MVFKYRILSDKLSLDDLLALSPRGVLGTASGGQVVTKVDEQLRVHLKTKTHKDGWPLYVRDVINKPNIDAHGDFFTTVPESMCSL